MSYIIITASSDKTSEQRCKDISEALWTLRRPRAIRHPRDVTNKFCGVVTHSDGRSALVLSTDAMIRPHEQLDTAELFDSMPEYTTQKKTSVNAKLAANYGVGIKVSDILPNAFSYTSQAEMEGDGWFPSIED